MDGTLFWNATTEEMKRGVVFNKQGNKYICIFCNGAFEQGVVYPNGDLLLDAQKAAETHVKTKHQEIFDFLLGMGRIYTGLSSGQTELARLFYEGHSDKEIASMTGTNSVSTIRNQRFAIREKYKQAKVLIALVELMETQRDCLKQERKATTAAISDDTKLVDFHPAATSIDERFAITQKEKDEVLSRYFDANGKLIIKNFPAKEKKKIIIMQKLMDNFHTNNQYPEKEVNEILKQYYDDFVSVRRCLIQYGFLDRDKEGKTYWVK